MKTIFKYPLCMIDDQLVSMPAGAEILTVQMQSDVPCLWARVDPNMPKVGRVIHINGTGHNLSHEGAYIGTFQMAHGALVFHAFDGGER